MSVRTVATQHTAATQKSLGGYAVGQLVHRDGVVWKSRTSSNLYPPGDHASWELVT